METRPNTLPSVPRTTPLLSLQSRSPDSPVTIVLQTKKILAKKTVVLQIATTLFFQMKLRLANESDRLRTSRSAVIVLQTVDPSATNRRRALL